MRLPAPKTSWQLVAVALTFASAPACEPAPPPGETLVFVVDEIRFLIEAEVVDGVRIVDGFDVDGIDGPVPEGNTCFSEDQMDRVAPDGRTGIDNSLAGGSLVTLVTLLADQDEPSAEIFENLVQGAVTGGTLLVLVEFDDVDSTVNDSRVGVTLHLAEPFNVGVGTDGRLLSGQTFDISPSSPSIRVEASIRDGVLHARDLRMQLAGSILDQDFDLPVDRGQLAVTFQPNGTIAGVLGGAVPSRSLTAVLEHSQFNGVRTLGERFITRLSDVMNPETGECDSLSVAARVHGVPAFVFTESRLSDAGSAP